MAKEYPDYFVGLDIGTNSAGIAACDEEYKLLRHKGNSMWSSMVFDSANPAEERRTFRTARRRNNRAKQRIHLLQELMAPAILQVDPDFFVRVKESALWADDKTTGSKFNYFNDENYTDKDYYKQYPTIHHLICELINNELPHDPRLVYIATSYILSHRGHFLNPANKDNIDEVRDISATFQELKNWYEITRETEFPFNCTAEEFGEVLTKNKGVDNKNNAFYRLLFNGKKPKPNENSPADPSLLLSLIAGKKTNLSKLFMNENYSELDDIDLTSEKFDEQEDQLRTELGDDFGLISAAKNLYDWSVISDMLNGKNYISESKVAVYEEHKKDLGNLRKVVKKYIPQHYNEIFRIADNTSTKGKEINNYTKYSGNLRQIKEIKNWGQVAIFKSCNQAEFCAYLKKKFDGITPNADDEEYAAYTEVASKIKANTLCPLQVNSDNRTIPYQLYYAELKQILSNAENYIPELRKSDKYGTVSEKILSIMTFKIPYYVGPLDTANSQNAWIVKKSKDNIYPWNFDDIVDHEKSENEFIRRMTCKCSYLAGEDVLPKNSLLYTKFIVLNEINTITINGQRLSAEAKQDLYNEVFMKRKKVSLKMIKEHFIANGVMKSEDILRGIDENVKSSLKPWHDFYKLMSNGYLTEEQVEEIILRITCTTDKTRLYNWLREKMNLTEADAKYVSALKYSDFGRLSKQLLTEIYDVDPKSGEIVNPNIIKMMWENNLNLMEILSQSYHYRSEIERINRDYYGSTEELSFNERMEKMYIPNAVRRPIKRSMEMLHEVVKICGKPPKRIFIEMARELTDPQNKGKRTLSRRDKIEEYFKKFSDEEISKIRQELEKVTNEQLQSDKLYLYFMQLGKCMYSREKITISDLNKKKADGKDLYDIDHIFPQSKVKDDSIDNRVLVLSTLNALKDDNLVPAKIRKQMSSFWKKLHDNKLISDKKFERLTRSTPFSDEELTGFINRQLVETRQSAKAVVELIKQDFPESEIVYVKAGLTSQFRQENNIVKCREINDLHHAKDAYLNIVMGNIYHVKFTKNPMLFVKEYRDGKAVFNLKIDKMLEHDVIRNGETAWKGDGSFLDVVMHEVSKNNVHYVVYTYRRKGKLFNANPERNIKGDSLVPRKKELSPEKYGGHNNTTASFFVFVTFDVGKKTSRAIIPVELMYAEKFEHDREFAKQYIKQQISKLVTLKAGQSIDNIQFPLGKRIIKVGTMIDIDGYRACIKDKLTKGRQLGLSQGVSLILSKDTKEYVKRLSSVYKKISPKDSKYVINEEYDKINAVENLKIYDILTTKSEQKPFSNSNTFKNIGTTLKAGRAIFETRCLNDQVKALMSIVEIYKTGRTGGCNLKLIGDVNGAAILTLNSTISNARGIQSIRIVDQSPTGLYETISPNLLEL